MARTGQLDRRITIQRASRTRNAVGELIDTWSTFAEAWAYKRDVRAGQRVAADQVVADIDTVFTIRYRAGVTPDMRVAYGGLVYDIKGVAELGRREWQELSCTARVV